MSEENKALLRRWFDEVWNNGRTEAINELFAEDGIAHGLSDDESNPMKGPEDFKPFHATFRGALPDITVEVEQMIAAGDLVAAICRVRGNHDGDHLGIAATKAPVNFSGMCFVRIKDGKIVEAWNNFDFMKLNRQIGLQ